MWVLPSDHYIGKLDVLEAALHSAVKSADDNKLVTFGITPTRPETGYGYIKCEKSSDLSILPVEKFVEKPDLQTAVRSCKTVPTIGIAACSCSKQTVLSIFQGLGHRCF